MIGEVCIPTVCISTKVFLAAISVSGAVVAWAAAIYTSWTTRKVRKKLKDMGYL